MSVLSGKNLNILNKAKKPIFNNFAFEIESGQIWMVMGPNGIGKSSLWESFIGIRRIEKGELFLNNNPISKLLPADRVREGMKYISQANSLFEDISVFDNLMIIAESLLKRRNRKPAVEKAIKTFDLKDLSNKKATQLSGGQKRRVELAKIMIGNSKIVLLDEPFAAIDEEYTEKISNIFKKMQQDGVSFLINDHNTQAIKSISDYCIHLAHAIGKKEVSYIEKITS